MKRIVLYSHGGSGNRGCEAIVRATRKILGNTCGVSEYFLATLNKAEDEAVKITGFKDVVQYSNYVEKNSFYHMVAAVSNRIFSNVEKYVSLAQKSLYKLFNSNSIAISVGGDNYCYADSRWLYISNKEAKKRNARTVLWGCSLEESNMDDEMLRDLNQYDLIIARESITYHSLLNKGIAKNTKLYPDPAFQLDSEAVELPAGFKEGETVGINLSPYIFRSNLSKEEVIGLYIELIRHIMATTNMQVALIPHVFWSHNHDLEVLEQVYAAFAGIDRVLLIREQYNCLQLKYLISRCSVFIGARTHSTIAAYSTCVPTLVLGYSVKSRGICRDIFGSEENMVLPVQSLKDKAELLAAFDYIWHHKEALKEHLLSFMPQYKAKAIAAGNEVNKLVSEKVRYEKQSV